MRSYTLTYTDPVCRKDGQPMVRTLGPILGNRIPYLKETLSQVGCRDFKVRTHQPIEEKT